jgi:Uncharacterised nucleotidyltransferase
VRIHWKLFHEFVAPASEADALWQATVGAEIGKVPTRVLGPADELLNVCLSGARASSGPSVRWVADAVAVLRTPGGEVDWQRLVHHAAQLRATLRLRDVLVYLVRTVAAPVPIDVVETCDRVRPTRRDLFAHRAGAWQGGIVGLTPEAIPRFLRATADAPLHRALVRLPGFLRDEWGLERTSHVPIAVIEKVVARASAAAQGAVRSRRNPPARQGRDLRGEPPKSVR